MASNLVDQYVGSRLRQRRTLLGISQEQLAQAVGITFQQIQKYEKGANRMGASRIYEMSIILQVPIQYFFDDMPEEVAAASPGSATDGVAPAVDRLPADQMARRETLEFVRNYYKIADDDVRQRVYALIKALAKNE